MDSPTGNMVANACRWVRVQTVLSDAYFNSRTQNISIDDLFRNASRVKSALSAFDDDLHSRLLPLFAANSANIRMADTIAFNQAFAIKNGNVTSFIEVPSEICYLDEAEVFVNLAAELNPRSQSYIVYKYLKVNSPNNYISKSFMRDILQFEPVP